jgi:hypothetical protein
MPNSETLSARYRSLAKECLEVAHTFREGVRRTVLVQMAQVWQRLADENDASSSPPQQLNTVEQPLVQQQQEQIPPKKLNEDKS